MVGWNHHLMACAVMLMICWNRKMTSATASPNAPRKVELRKAREENWRKKIMTMNLNMMLMTMLMMTMMSNDYANDDNDVDDNDNVTYSRTCENSCPRNLAWTSSLALDQGGLDESLQYYMCDAYIAKNHDVDNDWPFPERQSKDEHLAHHRQ